MVLVVECFIQLWKRKHGQNPVFVVIWFYSSIQFSSNFCSSLIARKNYTCWVIIIFERYNAFKYDCLTFRAIRFLTCIINFATFSLIGKKIEWKDNFPAINDIRHLETVHNGMCLSLGFLVFTCSSLIGEWRADLIARFIDS
jgi:D-alanyl-lipoteichoic acid acyltransferase DltB (MBOAT superfamily)